MHIAPVKSSTAIRLIAMKTICGWVRVFGSYLDPSQISSPREQSTKRVQFQVVVHQSRFILYQSMGRVDALRLTTLLCDSIRLHFLRILSDNKWENFSSHGFRLNKRKLNGNPTWYANLTHTSWPISSKQTDPGRSARLRRERQDLNYGCTGASYPNRL